ncbi:MAG: heavy-metal-associated domain-containing protein [Anaerolineae bacterium]|nr:heavy-metal-associated domain-containing protein [Anaerolineae bacterium]
MEKLSVEVPALYGDHHVTAVRAMLLGLPGVVEVYASSAFLLVEVGYDETVVSRDAILSQLQAAGYLDELAVPQETGRAMVHERGPQAFYRHTVVHANTGRAISFAQQVPAASRALWPCPGIGLLESANKELQNG